MPPPPKPTSKMAAIALGIDEDFLEGRKTDPHDYVGTNRIRIEPVTELRERGSVGYCVVKTLLRKYGVVPDDGSDDEESEGEELEDKAKKDVEKSKGTKDAEDSSPTADKVIATGDSIGSPPKQPQNSPESPEKSPQKSSEKSISSNAKSSTGTPQATSPKNGNDAMETSKAPQVIVHDYSSQPAHEFSRRSSHGSILTLRPVILDVPDGEIPTSLNHLHPDTPINIVDRESGRFLRGKEAILLKNLTKELREHASYEPIIPSLPKGSGIRAGEFVQEARSAPKTRVSGTIMPQPILPDVFEKGDFVVVKNGPSKGIVGTYEGDLSGGWALVKEYSRKQRKVMVRPINLGRYATKADKIPRNSSGKKRNRKAPTLMDVESEFIGSVSEYFDEQQVEMARTICSLNEKLNKVGQAKPSSENGVKNQRSIARQIENKIAHASQDMKEAKRCKKAVCSYSGVVFRSHAEGQHTARGDKAAK